MAVQQNRKTRSKRGMRRSHDAISGTTVTQEQATGSYRLRHHMSDDGFYRGRQVVDMSPAVDDEEEEGEE